MSKNITDELEKEQFISRSKDGHKGVFSRQRQITFSNLIVLIMSFQRALQRELDHFFKVLKGSDFNIREATKGALTQARAKLSPWAFVRLNEVAVDTFYNQAEYYVWKGMRVLSADGSRLMLPKHSTVEEEFGVHKFGPNADSPRSLALCSVLYDVLNQVTIDAEIGPYASSERELLAKHLDKVNAGDLLLLDRGYPSILLLYQLSVKKIEFCIRMKEDWWLTVKEFTESSDKERLVKFQLPKKDKKQLSRHPEIAEAELECRLIKIELENGEKEILCTSLIDSKEYPYEQFDALYHTRWNEEEAYKLLKARIDLEDFSGKTAKAVKQDFFAKIFLLTLTATYAHPIEEKVRSEYKADQNRKFDQKINRTNAVAMTKDILIGVFLKKQYRKALEAFDDIVYKTREIIRPGRSIPRKKRPKKTVSLSYKKL